MRSWIQKRFPLLRMPLHSFSAAILKREDVPKDLRKDLQGCAFPLRLMRYWWAGQALAAEAKRQGRPLRVLDLGCERGWLKRFTPEGAVEHWLGLDWNARPETVKEYDHVTAANFDETLPIPDHHVDAVVSLHVFEHLPRPGFTIAEVSRVLKVGGVFIAATPILPALLAHWRDRHYQHNFAKGKISPGGHINSFSLSRWRRLIHEVGLDTDFLTGSHGIRWSGSRLEDSRQWVRLNQLWAALFPSLGSECCLQARRTAPTHLAPVSLGRPQKMPRLVWAGLGTAAFAALVGMLVLLAQLLPGPDTAVDQKLADWIELKQDGDDKFYVWHEWAGDALRSRRDVILVDGPEDFPSYHSDSSYLLLSEVTSGKLRGHARLERLFVTNHIDLGAHDFLVLRTTDLRAIPLSDFM